VIRSALEGPVRRLWYGEVGPVGGVAALVTLPFAALFGLVVRGRNTLFDRGILPATKGPVPVVSVGNVVVGGTGKTPVAGWLLAQLQDLGRSPALVTRGYGRDEILLHRRWNPSVPVIAAPRRVEGVQEGAGAGADVCVVDDGFQHRRLARDLDIVLVSVRDPLPARVLPRGPYREPLSSLQRADLVLVTCHGAEDRPAAEERARELARHPRFPPVAAFPLEPGGWETLDGSPAAEPEGPVLVVSSVARPKAVTDLVREMGVEVDQALEFPDHYEYRAEDVGTILEVADGRTMVTTEKDAVKLAALEDHLPPTRVMTLRPAPAPGVVRIVRQLLERVLLAERDQAGDVPGRRGSR
jgi:tetraacyldisaccharide 4'-kinase